MILIKIILKINDEIFLPYCLYSPWCNVLVHDHLALFEPRSGSLSSALPRPHWLKFEAIKCELPMAMAPSRQCLFTSSLPFTEVLASLGIFSLLGFKATHMSTLWPLSAAVELEETPLRIFSLNFKGFVLFFFSLFLGSFHAIDCSGSSLHKDWRNWSGNGGLNDGPKGIEIKLAYMVASAIFIVK